MPYVMTMFCLELQKIPVSEIYEVSVRKFSFLQSSGLIAGTLLVAAGFLTIIGYGYGN